MQIRYNRLREHLDLQERACRWFHEKWGIPESAYRESMHEMNASKAVPQWYIAMDGDRIAGGLGVIENDFHDRKDLAPNVCAVYVEEAYRKQGIAGALLKLVCSDLHEYGIDTLYLLTDHTAFSERYGWQFFCTAQGDGEDTPARVYRHRYGIDS